jgi:cell division protein FtsQ
MLSRLMFAVTLASISVVVAGVWHVLDQPVRGFVIEGQLTALERTELRALMQQQPLAGILSTSLSQVRERLDALAWTRRTSVRRQWPDRLVLVVRKAAPVVRWGERQYLSAYGDLLTLPDEYPGLPQFDVAVAPPQQAMEVYQLLDQIAARESLAISSLLQNEQGEWSVQLVDGPRLLLGAEQLNERMHRFLLVHRRVLRSGPRVAQYVDARYASGVAIKFASESDADELLVAGAGGYSGRMAGD